ncbi:hypothetical protein HZB08_00425, partial [Candidatus Saganbacteria bacterium]|nr:hypothetical protein [Candidatus Saganbacteria bacterium]
IFIKDRTELAGAVVSQIMSPLKLSFCAFYLSAGPEGTPGLLFSPAYSEAKSGGALPSQISSNSDFITALLKTNAPRPAGQLPPLENLELGLVLPLFIGVELAGFILLSEKERGIFTDADLDMFSTLQVQISLSLSEIHYFEEYKNTSEKLSRSERLAEIGKLAGAIGHDLRNPLGIIRNSNYLLSATLGDAASSKIKKHLSLIDKEISISARIIEDVLTFARIKAPEQKEVDIKTLLEDALSRIAAPEGIKVETKIAEGVPPALIDREQIDQVFSHLISNAYQAMPQGGRLTLAASLKEKGIEVTFEDTGIGIPPENLQKIFDPFFTTQEKGTGLGLAICHSIIKGHRGELEVKSEVGKGTTLRVLLPREIKPA